MDKKSKVSSDKTAEFQKCAVVMTKKNLDFLRRQILTGFSPKNSASVK